MKYIVKEVGGNLYPLEKGDIVPSQEHIDMGYKIVDLTLDVGGNCYEFYNVDGTPDVAKITVKAQEDAIAYFTGKTDVYIQSKITEYNSLNGVAFADINSFSKYAINTSSVHNAIALQFITWVDLIWIEVRALTVAPTDVEFQILLDSVPF